MTKSEMVEVRALRFQKAKLRLPILQVELARMEDRHKSIVVVNEMDRINSELRKMAIAAKKATIAKYQKLLDANVIPGVNDQP